MPVGRAADRVFFLDYALQLVLESVGVEQIDHANPAPRHFVFVGWSDSARRGADRRGSARRLRRFIHFAVIRENQMRAIAEKKPPARFDSRFSKVFHFDQQGRGIHHGSRADDRLLARPQNSAGDQLQDVFMIIKNNGVAGVMSARVAGRIVERLGEVIHYLTLAFIAPLRPNHDNRFGPWLFCQVSTPPGPISGRTLSSASIPQQSPYRWVKSKIVTGNPKPRSACNARAPPRALLTDEAVGGVI